MPQFIISFVVGYILGSFPTAYILMKKKSNVDIRGVGSGNVGAMNAYEVSGSPAVAIIVMILDALKGVVSIIVCWLFFGNNFWMIASGGIGAIIGHNYPVWLNFKGGRGLSTTAGVMMTLGWIFVAVWCTIWAILYFAKKNIHTSNILASFASPIVCFIVPEHYLRQTLPRMTRKEDFVWLVVAVCFLIIIRHKEFFNQIFRSHQKVS